MSKPSQNQKISRPEDKLIEKELLRKRIYEKDFIDWSVKRIPTLKYKEVCHLLLRYLFNKIISKGEDEDPIFIETKSPLAEEQLKKDFVYYKLSGDPQEFIDEIEQKFSIGVTILAGEVLRQDRRVSLLGDKIMYGSLKYDDISLLGKKNPSSLKYALALNIRYNYLKLTNHGLARVYKDMAKPSEGCEAFASAFNHYFDSFCSAFPDLEKPFGSMGSFFNIKKWIKSRVYMNPPFDESLMTSAMERVMSYCKESKSDIEFVCTFPKWESFIGLESFRKCEWVRRVNVYEKGEIPFIDYMNDERIIYPCGIIEVIVGTKDLQMKESPDKLKTKEVVEIIFEDDD